MLLFLNFIIFVGYRVEILFFYLIFCFFIFFVFVSDATFFSIRNVTSNSFIYNLIKIEFLSPITIKTFRDYWISSYQISMYYYYRLEKIIDTPVLLVNRVLWLCNKWLSFFSNYYYRYYTVHLFDDRVWIIIIIMKTKTKKLRFI